MNAPKLFAELVTSHAIKAGYDLSGPRSGGRKALADDTGISHASVCRMLNGQVIPSAYSLQRLADAIDVPVTHLLEAAGVVSPGALTGDQALLEQPLTIRQAAARLGITKPLNVSLLEAITTTLLADQGATP
ncbi:helix-turn-helix domain-containing protein [Streptomyces sp. NPDC088353]|uniref:helix-turn-helix domain-containing protein n=1 Tax=Streptomyces sp. NPDC088353 TaxID=3365855 RepID=UPI0038238DB7